MRNNIVAEVDREVKGFNEMPICSIENHNQKTGKP